MTPYNPNTKWSLHIASITDLRLLPSPKSHHHRCFPTSADLPRALFIQTADGRSLTLKATKNIELERWFFVLAKMWAFQQLLQRTEEDLAVAAANATAATEAAAAARAGECNSRRESGGATAAAAAGGVGVGGEERVLDSYHQVVHHNHQQRNSNHSNNNKQQQHRQPQYQGNNDKNNYTHLSSASPLPPPPSAHPAPPSSSYTSHLPAHQQSSHLFNNYLQRQQMYFQKDQGEDYQHQQHQYAWHSHQHQQPQSQLYGNNKAWNKRQTAPPVATIVQESLTRYQIPLPVVSAFLPDSLDWPEQQQQLQQQQYQNERDEVADDQGAVVANVGGGAILSIEEEKAARRESGENIHNAYLRRNSLAVVDQYSSPTPLSSAVVVVVASHKNDNTTTTMTTGVGGAGGGGSGTGCDGDLNHITDGSMTRHGREGSWAQEPSCSIPTTEEVHAGSSVTGLGLHPQQQQQPTVVWPAAGTMEPAKVAAIDMWRRNLMSPLARANTVSSFHSDDPDNQVLVPASAAKLYLSRNNSCRPSAVSGLLLGPGLNYCCDANVDEADEEEEEEDPYRHYQQGPISPLDNSRPKLFYEQQQQRESPYQQPRLANDSTSETDNIPLAVVRTIRQNSIGTMDFQNLGPVEVRHYAHDDVHIDDEDEDEDEDETGAHDHAANKMNAYGAVKARRGQLAEVSEPDLLHVQQQQHHPRYSRWQKTQLSSEDESGTNRDSFAAPTNTPDMSRNSYSTFLATNYNNNSDSYLNLQNNCAGHERGGYGVDHDPYHSSGNGYESNKDSASLSDPTLNQHHPRVTAEPNLPHPSSSPSMSSTEFASVPEGGPAPAPTMMPSRQSMAVVPVQVKPAPVVGILKRPSLPGMDTAVLQAAVEASKAMQRQKTTSFQSLPSFSENNNGPIHPSARPSQPLPPSASTPTMNSFGTAHYQGAPFRTAHASGFLPPPPIRPPRRHPIRTSVASDIKFSPSRRNSQDGSIISGFGGNTAANLAGISSPGDTAAATATSPGGGNRKVEKSRSLLSFLTLNTNNSTSNNSKNFCSPKSNTKDSSSPPTPTVSPRRNSLPAVHLLGIGLSMMLATNNNNNNNNGNDSNPATTPPTAEVKKQRRSSILSLHRTLRNTDKTKKQELTAAGPPRSHYEQAEILLRDPSPPQTPAPATKSSTSNRRFSLPATVLSPSSPSSPSNSLSGYNGVGYNNGIKSSSTPSLLLSFPPTATRVGSAASSRPSSAYINAASNRLSASLSSGSLSRANSNASNTNRNIGELNINQYQRQSYPLKLQTMPLIQVDAPAPTPIPEKEKEMEEKENHKGYCRGKFNPDSVANGGGGCGNGYNGRPLTCCSESELIEVLNTNSEEDDGFCYF
ncbi:hypothetical protein BGW39_008157 [Mortierella sp. 14UC]|nr:hypothetical protein BGW39_008157 [Mortierella sp. 14UC]